MSSRWPLMGLLAIGVVTLGSMLRYGGIQPWLTGVLAVGGGIALVIEAVRRLSSNEDDPVSDSQRASKIGTILFAAIFLTVVFLVFQMTPLPGSLARWVGPESRAVYEGVGLEGSSWTPVSVRTFATRVVFLRTLSFLAMFMAVAAWARTRERQRRLLWIAVMTIGGVALLSVVQHVSEIGYPFPRSTVVTHGRLTGPYVNSNHVAALFALVLPVVLSMILARVPLKEKGWLEGIKAALRDSDKLAGSLLLVGVAILLCLALVLTRSRLGILAFIVATCGFVVVLWRLGGRRKGRKLTVLISVVGVMVVLAVGAGLKPVIQRFAEWETKTPLRFQGWEVAWAMFSDHPVAGAGAGTFKDVVPRYQGLYMPTYHRFNTAHNEILNIMTDGGLMWLVIMMGGIGAMGVTWYRGLQNARESDRMLMLGMGGGIGAILIHSLGDFPLQIPGNALLVAGYFALIWRMGGAPIPHIPMLRNRTFLIGALLLGGGLAVVGGLDMAVSSRHQEQYLFRDRDDILTRKAREIVNSSGDHESKKQALTYFGEAARSNPGSAEIAYERAELFIALGDVAQGEAEYERALRLQPNFSPLILNVAFYYGLKEILQKDKHAGKRKGELVEILAQIDPKRLAILQRKWMKITRDDGW